MCNKHERVKEGAQLPIENSGKKAARAIQLPYMTTYTCRDTIPYNLNICFPITSDKTNEMSQSLVNVLLIELYREV